VSFLKLNTTDCSLQEMMQIKLQEEHISERVIHEALAKKIQALEEGLHVIATEFSNESTRKRVDVLALDSNARLVIIEIKRGYTGQKSDLQTLLYAADLASMTVDDCVNAQAVVKINGDRSALEVIPPQKSGSEK